MSGTVWVNAGGCDGRGHCLGARKTVCPCCGCQLTLLRQAQCRPYNAATLHTNLHKAIGLADCKKHLALLAAEGLLDSIEARKLARAHGSSPRAPTYLWQVGKSQVYWLAQGDDSTADGSAAAADDGNLADESREAEAARAEASARLAKLKQELVALKHAPTTESAEEEIASLLEGNAELRSKLAALQGTATTPTTPQQRAAVVGAAAHGRRRAVELTAARSLQASQLKSAVESWRKRKRAVDTAMDMVLQGEGSPYKKPRDLAAAIGIETDDEAGVCLKGVAA